VPERLTPNEIERFLSSWPSEPRALALELRDLVLKTGPELAETIAFNALCYVKPGRPYGVIGGNVCMIDLRGGRLQLAFIHGASLDAPAGLLQGAGKAKRHIELRSASDIRRPVITKLIRAAIAYEPKAS
jgi:hypothetical protein